MGSCLLVTTAGDSYHETLRDSIIRVLTSAALPLSVRELAMKQLAYLIHTAFLLGLANTNVRADEALAPETARKLKDATVFVKVALGPLTMSGSGFVIQTTADSALIVTNQHVVTKPKVLAPGGFILGLRGRDRIALMRIQQILARSEPEVSVVFNSGEPNEQAVKAEVLAQVEEPDMAVLKVNGLKRVPQTVEFRKTIPLAETMPVFILGFPFGDSLGENKSNPNITIGKGSVSSIRKDRLGKVSKVQIDGALNPGNSGGPVVDAQGNLVGIAVQTIQGSNIGLTIPAAEVSIMLEGSLGKPTVAVTPAVNGGAPKYDIVVPVLDPLKKLRSASVQYVTKTVPSDPTKAGQAQLAADPASRKLELPLKSSLAKVELPLDAKSATPVKQLTVQASYVTSGGKIVYLEPQVVVVPAPVRVATTTDGKGATTTTITQSQVNGNGGTSRRQMTITRGGSSGNATGNSNTAKPAAFQVGDKVRVAWAGKIVTAEVTGFAATGWVTVKFPLNGIVMTPTLPPDQLQPISGSAKKATAKAEGPLKVGEKVEVAWAGKIVTAEVTGFAATGWIELKFPMNGIMMTPTLPPNQVQRIPVIAKKVAPAGATVRTWSSKTSKFKVEAKFVEVRDGMVTLEKKDGETVTVALDKLSEADQKAARELAAETEDDPFASK